MPKKYANTQELFCWTAARAGKKDVLKWLLKACPNDIQIKELQSALKRAADVGQLQTVIWLYKRIQMSSSVKERN